MLRMPEAWPHLATPGVTRGPTEVAAESLTARASFVGVPDLWSHNRRGSVANVVSRTSTAGHGPNTGLEMLQPAEAHTGGITASCTPVGRGASPEAAFTPLVPAQGALFHTCSTRPTPRQPMCPSQGNSMVGLTGFEGAV